MFQMCFAPQRLCTFSTAQLPKVLRTRRVLTLLTCKCASRHNGVHFFHISTSKSAPELRCFVHFDFQICFAPEHRALFFYISTSKSCPSLVCFVHFDFKMCFAPQLRALFPHLNFQKCSKTWRVLTLFTSKCASHHNGVQFFMSHLPRCLRTRRFSEPTFRPSGATKHWKNTVFRDFPTFSRTCIFSLLTFSIVSSSTFWLSPRPSFFLARLLPGCAFHLSILSDVSLRNFLRLLTIEWAFFDHSQQSVTASNQWWQLVDSILATLFTMLLLIIKHVIAITIANVLCIMAVTVLDGSQKPLLDINNY